MLPPHVTVETKNKDTKAFWGGKAGNWVINRVRQTRFFR